MVRTGRVLGFVVGWTLSIGLAVLCAIELAHAEGPDAPRPIVHGQAGVDVPVAGSGAILDDQKPYHEGPLATRDRFSWPEVPQGAEEFGVLGLLLAIVYGLRASGLARHSEHPSRR